LSKKPDAKKSVDSATSQAVKDTILSNTNAIIQGAIRMTLLAVTGTCKCSTCKAARNIAPHVNKILELGDKAPSVKAVE